MHIYADRIKETTAVIGSASIVLTGPVAGHLPFAAKMVDGDTCDYCIRDTATEDWEVGIATYVDPNILARTTIESSSNAGNPVLFSSGVKEIFMTAAASTYKSLFPTNTGIYTYNDKGIKIYIPTLADAGDPNAAQFANKTIAVTSPQVVTTAIAWPADRSLEIKKGGKINSESVSFDTLQLYVPSDFATVQSALDHLELSNHNRSTPVIINVGAGHYTASEPTFIHGDMSNVTILGETVDVDIASMVSVTGSTGAYSVTYSMAPTNVTVGDYLIIRGTNPITDLAGEHWGVWEVTGKSADSVTVLNTCNSTMTTSDASLSTATILKTVLYYPTSNGLTVACGGTIGLVDGLAVVGEDVDDSAYGIVSGSSGLNTSAKAMITGSATLRLGHNVGASGFHRSGIWCGYSSSIFCYGGAASCSNGENGWEADSGGFITTGWYFDRTIGNANGLSGFAAYNCAGIWAGNKVIGCGNSYHGISAQNGSGIVIGDGGCYTCRNIKSGVAAEWASAIQGNYIYAMYNGEHGMKCAGSSSITSANNTCSNNTQSGAYSSASSSFVCPSSTFQNNTGHGALCLNSRMDTANSTASSNTLDGFRIEGSGGLDAQSTYSYSNGAAGYKALLNGYLNASSAKGSSDGLTGASFFATTHGYIYAPSAVTSGATFTPPYNCIDSYGGFIHLKNIGTKTAISRVNTTLSSGVATYTPDLDAGQIHLLSFTGVTAFAFSTPTNIPSMGQELTIQLKNLNSSTAITPTFSGVYITGTIASIAINNSSIYTFKSYSGAQFILTGKLENILV